MFEALQLAVSAYEQYSKSEASDVNNETLNQLSSKLDEIARLIERSSNQVIETLLTLKRDELKGRLMGHIAQFRILHSLPRESRVLFQRDGIYLFNELKELASNRTSYNKPFYLYDFANMLMVLAPICAFGNRAIGVSEVRYLFEAAYNIGNSYTLIRVPNLLQVPAFNPAFTNLDEKFREWIDVNYNPFIRVLVEGHWRMLEGGSRLVPTAGVSVNGKPPRLFDNDPEGISIARGKENALEVMNVARNQPQFKAIFAMTHEMSKMLSFPRPRSDSLSDGSEVSRETGNFISGSQSEAVKPIVHVSNSATTSVGMFSTKLSADVHRAIDEGILVPKKIKVTFRSKL